MYLLYSILLLLGALLLSPYLLYLILFKEKYRATFGQRIGRLPVGLRRGEEPVIWLHAVSVGETLASLPLVAALKEHLPDYRIVVSTTTLTGQKVARERIGASNIFYFPYDFAWSVRRSLRTVGPAAVILMESELWPGFLRECRRREIPVIVANGRLSDRSFRRYSRFNRFARLMLDNVSMWLMQSQEDAGRLSRLGIPPERVCATGNLKYDLQTGPDDHKASTAAQIAASFGLTENEPLIIAGSTTEGEESIILDAFRRLRANPETANVHLLLAPRHPERFPAVALQVAQAGFSLARRSEAVAQLALAGPVHSSRQQATTPADVMLLDTIGELAAVFRLATAVFIGGSLVPKGGHNILEPASYGKAIVVGPHMENFQQVMRDFASHDAIVQLADLPVKELGEALSAALAELLLDESKRSELGDRARAVLLDNSGATIRAIAEISKLLSTRSMRRRD